MTHRAYFFAGDLEEGIEHARSFASRDLNIETEGNPDFITLRYGLFSVDDARAVGDIARQSSASGGVKIIVIATGRIFHEAQNALLKLFEEPPENTLLIVVVPSQGMLLPTLLSRVLPLPEGKLKKGSEETLAEEFIAASSAAREKIITKLLDRAKSDKDSEKQAARLGALQLAEELMRAAYTARKEGTGNQKSLTVFLTDLNTFIPILHDRSAPLKPIFEHILLTVPKEV
jgi:DNA polymerase III delta prime subunit